MDESNKYENIRPRLRKMEEERLEFKKQLWKIRQEEMKKQGGILPDWQEPLTQEEKREQILKDIDKPGTMSNGSATLFWVVAMIVSLLFKGGWMLCILETIIWFKHITR